MRLTQSPSTFGKSQPPKFQKFQEIQKPKYPNGYSFKNAYRKQPANR
jgi:hypothetical protein